ncbi:MAG: hypothetical protein MUD08_00460 [Cytophagales bacterium]|nr:hypothetical protein [Cytophagales bacterium]
MECHESVRLYLDNDETGCKRTEHALSSDEKYTDESRPQRRERVAGQA